jgi:hypothetical protein
MKPIINKNDFSIQAIKFLNNEYNHFIADVDWKEIYLLSLTYDTDILFAHVLFSQEHIDHILQAKYNWQLI